MAAFEFTSFFPLPSVFCSEHLPLHDASPRHSDPGQHENNRRSGLRAGGSERVCQEEQQRKWLRYTFSEDVVCLERLLPGEGTLVQIIVFDGTKYIVKEGKVWLNLTLLLKKKPLQNEPFLACFAHTILRVTFCSQSNALPGGGGGTITFPDPSLSVWLPPVGRLSIHLGHQQNKHQKLFLEIISKKRVQTANEEKQNSMGLPYTYFMASHCGVCFVLSFELHAVA